MRVEVDRLYYRKRQRRDWLWSSLVSVNELDIFIA